MLENGHVALAVKESEQGATDLNGDGDVFDVVLFVHDLASGVTQNTRAAVTSASWHPSLADDLYVCAISEAAQGGADLNRDGDTDDSVLHVFHRSTGVLSNIGLAVGRSALDRSGNLLFFEVDENEQGGSDLDGDGDTSGHVLHVLDVTSGTWKNLATPGRVLSDGDRIVVSLGERGRDSNGDGDTLDIVWHLLGKNSRLVDLGLSGGTTESDIMPPAFSSGLLPLRVSEAAEGDTDLDGDGNTSGVVLHVIDLDPD